MYDIVISALSSHAQSKSSTGYDDDSAKVLCSVTQFKKKCPPNNIPQCIIQFYYIFIFSL